MREWVQLFNLIDFPLVLLLFILIMMNFSCPPDNTNHTRKKSSKSYRTPTSSSHNHIPIIILTATLVLEHVELEKWSHKVFGQMWKYLMKPSCQVHAMHMWKFYLNSYKFSLHHQLVVEQDLPNIWLGVQIQLYNILITNDIPAHLIKDM